MPACIYRFVIREWWNIEEFCNSFGLHFKLKTSILDCEMYSLQLLASIWRLKKWLLCTTGKLRHRLTIATNARDVCVSAGPQKMNSITPNGAKTVTRRKKIYYLSENCTNSNRSSLLLEWCIFCGATSSLIRSLSNCLGQNISSISTASIVTASLKMICIPLLCSHDNAQNYFVLVCSLQITMHAEERFCANVEESPLILIASLEVHTYNALSKYTSKMVFTIVQ